MITRLEWGDQGCNPRFVVTTVITERGRPLRKVESALAHPLVRETLYEELSLVRRVRLHGEVADAIERLYADDLYLINGFTACGSLKCVAPLSRVMISTNTISRAPCRSTTCWISFATYSGLCAVH